MRGLRESDEVFEDLGIGQSIGGRYRLQQRLGCGTFASVWRAVDGRNGYDVAIKVLYDHLRGDRRVMQRFAQEAAVLQRLVHPNIARALDASIEGPHAYLVMEHLRGVTLGERVMSKVIEGRHFPLRGAAWFCERLCAAVSHAHARGVIHRDLKPANVMVNVREKTPFLKVLDFGIAKVLDGALVDPTTAGRVVGSILYLAPEQLARGTLDARADVFSLATVLFEVVTQRRAWARGADGLPLAMDVRMEDAPGNNQFAVLHRIMREARPRASAVRSDVPAAVDEVLATGMAIEPEQRYPTPAELALAFRAAIGEAVNAEHTVMPRDPLGMLETLPEVKAVRS